MVRRDNHTQVLRFLLGVLSLACVSCAADPVPPKVPTPPTESSAPAAPAPSTASIDAPEPPHELALPAPLYPPTDRAWLGIEMRDLEPGVAGVRIARVFRGSPAHRNGLLADDVIVSVDGRALSEPREVNTLVQESEPGRSISVGLLRAGQPRLFKIELGNVPEAEDMARLHFIGTRAPDFADITPVKGDVARSLGELSGRVVVLEFWAQWCGVCRYLVPTMNQWYASYRSQGVAMLGVTTDTFEIADRTAQALDMQYPVATDASGETTVAYGANAVPMVFIIDQRGVVRDVMVGFRKRRITEMKALVDELLDQG